jgi:hypothetical protein
MAAFLAGLLPQILPMIGTLVVAGLGWLTLTVQKKFKADSAWAKLANIAIALAGKAWERVGPEVQKALADGKITAEERAAIEAAVMQVVEEATDKATLEQIGAAVGLPMPGIIAWIASYFIDKWTAAHDPSNTSVSKLAFPVTASESELSVAGAG